MRLCSCAVAVLTCTFKCKCSISLLQVASIVGRAEVLSCIFFLLSVLSYCKGVSQGCGHSLSPLPRPNWKYVLASIFLCLCAMLSKEQGIVSLGVCATFDIILHWEVFWAGLCSFLKTRPRGAAVVEGGGDANGSEEVVLKEKLSIGGVVEERNGYHGNVGDTTNGKCIKPAKRWSGRSLVMSALAKRLGNLVEIYCRSHLV